MEEMLGRLWNDLIDRVGGPMSFRLVLQPAMARVFVFAVVMDAIYQLSRPLSKAA